MAESLQTRHERLEEEIYWSDLLSSVAQAIAERQSSNSILRVVVHYMTESFQAAAGSISVRDRHSDTEKFQVVHGGDNEITSQLRTLEGETIRAESSSVQSAFRPNEPVSISLDTGIADGELPAPYRERLERARETGMRNAIVVPVMSVREHFATGWLLFAGPKELSEYEHSFLRKVAQLVSVTIQQSHAYSDLESAYRDLKETREAAMQRERLNAMGQMASGIAHDINNSLMPITSYVDVILETESGLTDRGKRLLETMQKSAWGISDATKRMKKFYRKEDDAQYTSIDVSELIDAVLELTQPRWRDVPQQQGIVITTARHVEPNLPPLYAAENEVREALTNLIFNAVDAMPEGGNIIVSAYARDDGYLVLSVEDTGKGMREEERQKALEPFYTSKGEQGTGMGLATVYGTMRRHEGDLEIESSEGEGTQVTLIFPPSQKQATASVQEQTESRPGPPMRVLCVDDDPTVLQTLRDMLETDGHTVRTADGGVAASQIVEEKAGTFAGAAEPFDAVVTDLGMPYMDGRELARRVKEKYPSVPVVLLSGWRNQMDPQEAQPEHVDAFLGKPPKLYELRSALQPPSAEQ